VVDGGIGSGCFFFFPKGRRRLNLEGRGWGSLGLSWLSLDDEEDKRGLGDRIRGGDRSLTEEIVLISEGRGDVIRVPGGEKDPGIEGSSDFDSTGGLLAIGLSSTLLDSELAKTSKVPGFVIFSVGGNVDGPAVGGVSSFLKISSNPTFFGSSVLGSPRVLEAEAKSKSSSNPESKEKLAGVTDVGILPIVSSNSLTPATLKAWIEL